MGSHIVNIPIQYSRSWNYKLKKRVSPLYSTRNACKISCNSMRQKIKTTRDLGHVTGYQPIRDYDLELLQLVSVLNPVGALHGVIFTPFSNMEQDECEDIANSFSSNLADLLEVPIFNFNTPAIEEMGYQVNSLFRSRDWL
eukprot:sb/3474265/